MRKSAKSIAATKAWETKRANANNGKKRGRKPGVKVGPYKIIPTLREMYAEIKELRAKIAKLEKVLS